MKQETGNCEKKVTINDIAAELGCSKSTVSRAISGNGRISKEVCEKVMDCCEKYGYKPNGIAKSLAQSKTYNIGVVLPADQDLSEIPFFQHCLLGICEMAATKDYDVIATTIHTDDISKLKRIVEHRKVDGIILTRTLDQDPQEAFLRKSKIPFVVIGSSKDSDIVQVDNDHIEACRELTSLLIAQSMKRIAFIGGNLNHVVNRHRYEGFIKGCEQNKLTPEKELLYLECNAKFMVDKAVSEILTHAADCIVCMDDKICHYVLQKLSKEQVAVPEQMKVASFYDSALLESYTPAITALKFDTKALGIESCKMLLDLIDGKHVARQVLLGYDIVVRSSTKSS